MTGRGAPSSKPFITLILSLGPVLLAGSPLHAQECVVRGRVASAGHPLPGVAVSAAPAGAPGTLATASGLDGTFVLHVTGPGRYELKMSLGGFAEATHEVVLAEGDCRATPSIDVEMTLLSRVPPSTPPAAPAAAAAEGDAGRRPPEGARGRAAALAERFRSLRVSPDAAGQGAPDAGDAGAQSLLPPGFSADAPTESVALSGSGNAAQTVDVLLYGDRQQWLDEAGGDLDALARRLAQAGIDMPPGGRGGGPFPGGGFGPGGFGGPGGFFGGRGFGAARNRVQGSVFYDLAGAPFDARPYALNGAPTDKASYFEHRFGATLGGPLKIPHVYDGSARTSFFLNYNGSHTRRPYDAYSTVPTAAERAGDFSLVDEVIVDPVTGAPFPGDVIPADRLDPSARALLAFIPVPNQAGATQNFHYVTSTRSSFDQVSLRLTHVLGGLPDPRQGRGRPGGGAGGPRPSGGTGGGRAGGASGRAFRRPSLTLGLTYRHSTTDDTVPFPTLGGSTRGTSWDVPLAVSFPIGSFFHQLRLDYNRNRTNGQNLYAGVRDVAGEAGIRGASSDPFDWGVPNLSFSSLASVRDRSPVFRLDQRFSVGEVATRTWGAHNVRVGGGFRAQTLDSAVDANARGSFVFTGLQTGSDFADFLLGLPQQASVQFGPGRIKLSGTQWSLFLQDDWRLHGNLTLNLGLRYEYVSPFTEEKGRLVNLDVPGDFTAAVPVLAGQAGPFNGVFPAALVRSDWNNVAPRVGAAWKVRPDLTVRAGFGVNYSLGVYGAIATRLSQQPPFAVSNTLIGGRGAPLLLGTALTLPGPATTNSYGIDPGYALPAVALWNLDVQRQFGTNLVVNVGYSGTRGYDLDLERAPNRGPTGLRIPGVAPFVWESSGATSVMHSGTVRLRRRMAHGFGGGFSYTYGRSIDDASTIGGGATVVAQDDRDLEAERGLSSFDRRHNLSADWLLELPVGPGRRWLQQGTLSRVLGGWVWSGTLTLQSGTPFTARVLGDVADVARGVNGTLRADVTGQPLTIADPNVAGWFNTAAFALPAEGTFGDAGRNTIVGPGTFLVNMGLIKNIDLGRPRTLSIRVQATNILNTPPLLALDTVVNSPTFGQVVQVGAMRSVRFQTRLRF